MTINKDSLRLKRISQQKLDERESWHKLVVKVIIWNEGSVLTNTRQNATVNKITLSEWSKYRRQIIKMNINQDREKVLSDLKYTLQKIKLNGGLEE